MLLADATRDYAAGVLGRTDIETLFASLERRARREAPGATIERSADLRYRGQSYELNVPWKSQAKATAAFHGEHARIYGYGLPGREVEAVTIRLRARQSVSKPRFVRTKRAPTSKSDAKVRRVWVAGAWRRTPVWDRDGLGSLSRRGPALIADYGSTTLIPAGWRFRVDTSANLIIERV